MEGESRRTIGGVEIYVWVLIIFSIVASVGGFTWLNYPQALRRRTQSRPEAYLIDGIATNCGDPNVGG